jgi:hypothetical protein
MELKKCFLLIPIELTYIGLESSAFLFPQDVPKGTKIFQEFFLLRIPSPLLVTIVV